MIAKAGTRNSDLPVDEVERSTGRAARRPAGCRPCDSTMPSHHQRPSGRQQQAVDGPPPFARRASVRDVTPWVRPFRAGLSNASGSASTRSRKCVAANLEIADTGRRRRRPARAARPAPPRPEAAASAAACCHGLPRASPHAHRHARPSVAREVVASPCRSGRPWRSRPKYRRQRRDAAFLRHRRRRSSGSRGKAASAFSAASALVALESLTNSTRPMRPTCSMRCARPGKLRRPARIASSPTPTAAHRRDGRAPRSAHCARRAGSRCRRGRTPARSGRAARSRGDRPRRALR